MHPSFSRNRKFKKKKSTSKLNSLHLHLQSKNSQKIIKMDLIILFYRIVMKRLSLSKNSWSVKSYYSSWFRLTLIIIHHYRHNIREEISSDSEHSFVWTSLRFLLPSTSTFVSKDMYKILQRRRFLYHARFSTLSQLEQSHFISNYASSSHAAVDGSRRFEFLHFRYPLSF